MPRIPLGLSAFERTEGDLPQTPVINLYAEQAPTEEAGVALQSRPGLSDRSADMGTNIEALFKQDGVLSGALFGVSGGNLYSGTTSLGSVSGSGPVSITGNEIGVVVTAGGTPRYYNGTTLADITFPDSANVVKVIDGASRFIFLREGTGKFYWTPALAATVDALAFATAESAPDAVLDGVFISDMLVLGGGETTEFWQNTGNSDLPFQPLEASAIPRGVKATGCMVIWDSTFAMVGNDNTVRVGQGQTRISNPGLEEKIAASSSVRLWTFQLEGQEFLALRLDSATYVFGNTNNLWSEFQSYGQTNWLPRAYAGGVFGCSNGKTAEWGCDRADFAGGTHERRFRFGTWDIKGVISSVQVECNPGTTDTLVGENANPELEIRQSLDHGKTWQDWQPVSLGPQGDYSRTIEKRGWGMGKRGKGRLFEARVTKPTDFRVSAVKVNGARGGR